MKVFHKGSELSFSTLFRNTGDELIVFIHGGGCAKESFQNAWDKKELASYSLLAFDLIGHGQSSKPQDFSYTMEDHTALIKELLDQFNHAKIHIAAHSMGGIIGLLLAEKLGHGLVSFISVEGKLVGEDCGVSRLTAQVTYKEFTDSFFQGLINNLKNSSEKSEQIWANWIENTDPLAFYKCMQSTVKWSDSNRLIDIFNSLPGKKIYLYGDKNADKKANLLKQLNEIPSISISSSGHFPMLDNSDEFYKLLAQTIK